HYYLILSEKNRAVKSSERKQQYSDHPERFNTWEQVLSKESVCGRCYWEVEWSSERCVFISVSYKDIRRKGRGNECGFGHNNQSWSLECSSSSLSFYHNNIETDLRVPSSSRIGVYGDHSAGTLSFYSVSDMKSPHHIHSASIRWVLALLESFVETRIISYRPLIRASKLVLKQVKSWLDCFECTDWQMFRETATNGNSINLEEYTASVTSYIGKCIDDVTISKTITTCSNQKP
ncbi:hypothetical protein QTP70_001469, partial [Hemibagrus guttatus]